MQAHKAETDYFKKRANTLNILNRGKVKPKLSVYDNLFNRLFGNGKIEIQPQGNVDITAGYQGQNIKNPTLPEKARKNGGFDFDMAAQLNVNANIGDKLKFPISYNTLANFDFTNQLKLDYTGTDDEIIKTLRSGKCFFSFKKHFDPGSTIFVWCKNSIAIWEAFYNRNLGQSKITKAIRQPTGWQLQHSNLSSKQMIMKKTGTFCLAQYFKDNYNKAMSNLPAINYPGANTQDGSMGNQ